VQSLPPELGFHSHTILPPLAVENCNDGYHGGCSGVKVDGSRTAVVRLSEGWRGAAMVAGAGS